MQKATVAEQTTTKIFTDVREVDITRAIANEFHSVLMGQGRVRCHNYRCRACRAYCKQELSNMGFKVLVIEQNNYLGGGYWLGGYMMNPVTVREPAQKIWDELGIPYKKVGEGLYLTAGPHAVSKLIAAACDSGVKFLNLTNSMIWFLKMTGLQEL